MNKNLKGNVLNKEIWIRGLYMLLFGIIYSLAELVAIAVVVLQFLIRLVTGKSNLQLLDFGMAISVYIYQIWRFLTFNSEELPYPFGRWPDRGSGPE